MNKTRVWLAVTLLSLLAPVSEGQKEKEACAETMAESADNRGGGEFDWHVDKRKNDP